MVKWFLCLTSIIRGPNLPIALEVAVGHLSFFLSFFFLSLGACAGHIVDAIQVYINPFLVIQLSIVGSRNRAWMAPWCQASLK